MNCKDVQAQLAIYLDGNFEQPASEQFKQHLANCVHCGDALQQELAIRAMLRESQVPPPNPDFVNRAFKAAFTQQHVKPEQTPNITDIEQSVTKVDTMIGTKSNTNSHDVQPQGLPKGEVHQHTRQGFYWGFSSAIAAGLMIWVVTFFLLGTNDQPGGLSNAQLAASVQNESDHTSKTSAFAPRNTASVPTVKVNLNSTQNIKLAFNAMHAVDRATIVIRLPDHVSLQGFPGEREISWNTALAAGDNTLTLPIVAEQLNSGELIARVKHAGGEQSFSLNVKVITPNMSNIPYGSQVST